MTVNKFACALVGLTATVGLGIGCLALGDPPDEQLSRAYEIVVLHGMSGEITMDAMRQFSRELQDKYGLSQHDADKLVAKMVVVPWITLEEQKALARLTVELSVVYGKDLDTVAAQVAKAAGLGSPGLLVMAEVLGVPLDYALIVRLRVLNEQGRTSEATGIASLAVSAAVDEQVGQYIRSAKAKE
jgi:hypothetical protein